MMPVAVARRLIAAERCRSVVLAFPAEAVVLEPLLVLLGTRAPALDARQLGVRLGGSVLGLLGSQGRLGIAPALPCLAGVRSGCLLDAFPAEVVVPCVLV